MIPLRAQWLIDFGDTREPVTQWSLAVSISPYSGRVQAVLIGNRVGPRLEGMWIGDWPKAYASPKGTTSS